MKKKFQPPIGFLFCLMIITQGAVPALAQKVLQKNADRRSENFIENLLKKYPQYFGDVLNKRDVLKVQIIYTQINRDKNNRPSFKNFYFHVSDSNYFYPASTVKMPVAFLALQRLHELRIKGLDRHSTLITENGYSRQTKVLNDPTATDGRPTIAQYIKKIFLVSDNDAFNRLYEFLGQEYINKQLFRMGYKGVEIRHRLQVALSADENAHTNPVSFYHQNGKLLYRQAMRFSSEKFLKRNDFVGTGYYQDNELISHTMNFSDKNRISLEDLHNILKTVIFPEAVASKQRFHLSAADYKFLYKYMSQYPAESKFPSYDTLANWDAYCKFLYWGSDTGKLPKNIRIFNKVGDAYGFLTDVSYLVDFDTRIEFMLSATIYCNKDGVLNDDKYDYDETGLPFMKQLGRVIYDYEMKRKKTYLPDLSKFRIKYDQ
jgi:hypothetical protein